MKPLRPLKPALGQAVAVGTAIGLLVLTVHHPPPFVHSGKKLDLTGPSTRVWEADLFASQAASHWLWGGKGKRLWRSPYKPVTGLSHGARCSLEPYEPPSKTPIRNSDAT